MNISPANAQAIKYPNVSVWGKSFESPEAQDHYLDKFEKNSELDTVFVKGFRGRFAEAGAIAGAFAGGAAGTVAALATIAASTDMSGVVAGVCAGLPICAIVGFWGGMALGGGAGFGVGLGVDKTRQAAGAPEMWFRNGF